MRRSRISAPISLVVLSILLAVPASAQVIYSTGFEAPVFSPGILHGQDGWISDIGPSFVTVQSSVVKSGSQAVRISATNAPDFARAGHGPTVTPGTSLVSVSVDAYIDNSGTASTWSILDTFGDTGFLAAYRVAASGEIFSFGGAGFTGVFVTKNTWHRYELVHNVNAGTYDMFLDNTLVAGNQAFATSTNSLNFTTLSLDGNTNTDNAYFDNFKVEVIPEPTTLVLLSFGLAGFGAARRRTRQN